MSFKYRISNSEHAPDFEFSMRLDEGNGHIDIYATNQDGDEQLIAYFDEDGVLQLPNLDEDFGLPLHNDRIQTGEDE